MRLFIAHPFNNKEGYKVYFCNGDQKGILASCVIMFHGLPLNAWHYEKERWNHMEQYM